MKYIYKEKVVFTKEEVAILDKAKTLLENINQEAKGNSDIELFSGMAIDSICELLSDEYSDME